MSVKVGIIGFAHGHVMSYAKGWQTHPELGVELIGGWDSDAARAKSSCEALSIKPFPSLDELFAAVDAVVISCETAYHADMTEAACEAKKDIICYKPMAITLREADRMVKAVEESGVRFTLGYQMRVDPQNIKIKQLIADGTIGKIYSYRRRHGLGTHIWANFADTWHVNPALNRDIFADDSAHPIDMLNWIFGVPETVSAEISTMHNPRVKNDNGVALFKYADGMIADISCSFTCSASEITTEVYGEKGTIQQYFGDNPATRLPRTPGMCGLKWFTEGNSDWTASDIPSPISHGERIAAQYLPFADFLNGRRGPVCSVYEARDSLRMVLACYLSAREGCRVRIDDPRVYEI